MRRLLGSAARSILAIVGLACAAPAAMGGPPQENTPVNEDRVPGEYLVTLEPGIDQGAVTDVYGRFGLARVQDLGRGIFLISVTDDPGPRTMDETRRGDPRIKAIQPNYRYRSN